MILKQKRKLYKPLILILTVAFLSILTISKQEATISLHNASEWILSQDLGLSTFGNLTDTGDGEFASGGYTQPISDKISSLIKAAPNIIKYKISNESDKKFKRLDVDIKFQDYMTILEDRKKAINTGQLFNPRMVKASIKFNNKTYKAKIRLKGDLKGHWLAERRMSFRVKLKNNSILGFKEFGIQKPRERQFPYDHTYQRLSKETGNLHSAQNFVHLFVNGSDWGIMNVEEHFTKELLEKQRRKESLIVRFSKEEETWPNNHVEDPYYLHREYDSSLHVKPYKGAKYLEDAHYRKVFSYISNNHLSFTPNLYDINSMTKAYILALSWGHMHALRDNNAKYYFNPYTLKLEPIATDQYRYHTFDSVEAIENWPPPPQFYSISFQREYQDNLHQNIKEVERQISNVGKYLNISEQIFPVDQKKNIDIVHKNYQKISKRAPMYLSFDKRDELPMPFLSYVDNSQLDNPIPSKVQASRFKNHVHLRHYTNGDIEVYNLVPDDVVLQNLTLKGQSIIDAPVTIPGYIDNKMPYIVHTDITETQDEKILAYTKYQGFFRKTINGASLTKNVHNPLLETTKANSFLVKSHEGSYKIINGSWRVSEPLVINGDLEIEEGVELQFDSHAYLIVKGAISAIGSKDHPIKLSAQNGSWKGIYVLNAGNKSILKHVLIQNTSALTDGILKLSGGVTFYKSNVDIHNTKLVNSIAEDSLNIVESNFSIKDTEIRNSRSDSFDSDFSKGVIYRSTILNSGGDALDFSGSEVEIRKTEISSVKDKAISAGEASNLIVDQANMFNIGVGIASKDGSKAIIRNCSIENYKLHAAMSYTKKHFYNNPLLFIKNCSIKGDRPFFSQDGSTLMFDNKKISNSYLDVKELYKDGVMKK